MQAHTDMHGPRLGTFLTMVAGLLVFFGFLARIHQVPGRFLSASSSRPALMRRGAALVDDACRSAVVFGARSREHGQATPTSPADRHVSPVPPPAGNPGPVPGTQTPLETTPGHDAPAGRQPRKREPRPTPSPRRGTQRERRLRPAFRYYAVKPGDTLWKIALREYGDGSRYHLILRANPGVSPSNLPLGLRLRIPPPPSVARAVVH